MDEQISLRQKELEQKQLFRKVKKTEKFRSGENFRTWETYIRELGQYEKAFFIVNNGRQWPITTRKDYSFTKSIDWQKVNNWFREKLETPTINRYV